MLHRYPMFQEQGTHLFEVLGIFYFFFKFLTGVTTEMLQSYPMFQEQGAHFLNWLASLRNTFSSGTTFSKVLYIVTLYSKYSRALTFKFLFFCVCGSPLGLVSPSQM
jgi:hypothetical protein